MKIPSIGLKKVRITFHSRIHTVGSGIGCRVGGRGFDSWIFLCKGVGIPEFGKFLLMDIQNPGKIFAYEIRNTAFIRNPTNN